MTDLIAPIKAVAFDFSGVLGTIRMAFSDEDGDGPYRVELFESSVDCVTRLRAAGFKTALITNSDRDFFEESLPDVDLTELFDVTCFSSDAGVSKPDPRIYQAAVAGLGLAARECLYMDDVIRNVDSAVAIGMQGTYVESPAAVVGIVDAVLAI